jgi:ERCC4-type nuclease
MTVWADKHEKGGMIKLVKAQCENVRLADDFGGDYAVGGYLVERKRWNEIAGRMIESDRNLYYQVDKLVSSADALDLSPLLLLEGEIGSSINYSRLSEHKVAEYLAGLPIMGVTIAPSTSRKCSAKIIARWEDGTPPDVRRIRGTARSDKHTPRFIIEGFPGIGPKTAKLLLNHFGTVMNVITAEQDELLEIDGIGSATVETINEIRHREHVN